MRIRIASGIAIAAMTLLSISPVLASNFNSGQMLAQTPTTSANLSGSHRFERGLNLSDAQMEKLLTLKRQYSEANGPKKLELKSLRNQERDLLGQPAVDKAAVLNVQGKINDLKAQLANSRVSFMADSSTIFTPEQREKMHHFMLKRELMGGRYHGRRGRFEGRTAYRSTGRVSGGSKECGKVS